VIGNHDAGLLWPAPRRIFEERVGVEVVFYPVFYRFNGVHVEHGHQHEELSRMDMDRPFITHGLPEPVLNLPWGSLFVAVMLSRIKVERPHVDKVRPFSSFLRYVLLHDTLWSIGAILRTAWFAWETVMFRSQYHIRSGLRASWRMFRELSVYPDFDRAAEGILARDPGTRLVIFGHTHVLRHRRFEDGREYVNEGSWNEATHLELGDFGTQVRLTYALVVCSGITPRVSVKRWRGRWRPDPDVVF
jgi:UDP-2,3-diacylglucosamine pyrophosphatase LpxH